MVLLAIQDHGVQQGLEELGPVAGEPRLGAATCLDGLELVRPKEPSQAEQLGPVGIRRNGA